MKIEIQSPSSSHYWPTLPVGTIFRWPSTQIVGLVVFDGNGEKAYVRLYSRHVNERFAMSQASPECLVEIVGHMKINMGLSS